MFKTTIIYSKYDLNKIQQMATNIKKNYYKTTFIDENVITKIVEETKEKFKLSSKEEALILITGLLQKGGSNKNAANSVKFVYDNSTLSAKEFKSIIQKIKKNMTIRQFAKYFANDIAKVSLLLELEGDLSNQMKYEYPNLTMEEAVWCSNFQTTNPNCPPKIRNWLVKNYRNRFNR